MRWLWLSLLLLLADPAWALRICTPGDTQTGVMCTGHVDAWTHLSESIDWIAANPTMCDVVVFPGDIVDGRGWTTDCDCEAQEAVDCTTLSNRVTGDTCVADECGDAEAINCVGGTAGHYCEQTRAAALMSTLAAAGVPTIVVNGNHDSTTRVASCVAVYDEYNTYFPVNGTGFDETGTHSESIACAGTASGLAEQAVASYHVLTADNAQWLFIALPFFPVPFATTDAANQSGMTNATLAWAKDVIEAHPGMPTIPIAHTMLDDDCNGDQSATYEDKWCNEAGSWETRWTGMTVYDELMTYPQVFLTLGGHIRELAQAVSANTTHRVLGAAVDYTDDVTGAPAWQYPDTGGGGVIQILRVEAVNGVVSSKAYSDTESAWVDVYGAAGSNWFVQMPLCDDETRFDFPAAACPERVFTPSINLGNIRIR